MRYNSESLEITLVISGNVLLFKDIKISLGLFITARKIPALFRENRSQKVSQAVNNLIRVSAVEPKIKSKYWFLASHYKINLNADKLTL